MTVQETASSLKDWGLSYIRPELEIDFQKFDKQASIVGHVAQQDQDQLIPGILHEKSVWNLSKKYRYEILTPWETEKGKLIEVHSVITSDTRLTPNEVFEAAADHPSLYPPEEAAFRGEMEIEGVWYR